MTRHRHRHVEVGHVEVGHVEVGHVEVRGGRLDRPFTPEAGPPTTPDGDEIAYVFAGRRLLVVELDADNARLPSVTELASVLGEGAVAEQAWLPLGRWQIAEDDRGPRSILTRRLEGDIETPSGWTAEGLRGLYGRVEEDPFWLAARAIQIVDWHENHRFCGRCGRATEHHATERARICTACDLSHFPRLAPAVIVLIERGEEVLLGRSPHFPEGMFSTLAGFVEPGESLEQAVRREVEEEVGVSVDEIRYFGSQPWPFPNSLMVGFRARWVSGEITVDGEEIAEAGWFHFGELPRIPPRLSIARSLIEAFRAERHSA